MPGPENYNDSSIVFRIDPMAMWTAGTVELPKVAGGIGDSIDNIIRTWEGLRSSWFGGSAVEAQDFINRFNANLIRLFGTRAAPSSGALPKIASAVGLAAVNFGGTEHTVMRMFESLSSGLDPNAPPPRFRGAPITGPWIPKSTDTPPGRKVSGGQVDENTP